MGKNTVQAKPWLYNCYGESSPSRQIVEKSIGEFERDSTSVNNAQWLGSPKDVTTPKII